MSAFTVNHFDVLDYIEKAEKLGVPSEIAKFQAREMEFLHNKTIEDVKKEFKEELHNKDLATKGNVRETELRLQKEIEVVRKEIEVVRKEIEKIRKEMSDLRYETLKFIIWTGVGVSAVILGGMFTLLKLMLH